MSKKIKNLKEQAHFLRNELDALINEHDFYSFDTEEEARVGVSSLPIENLHDLWAFDHHLPNGKWHLSYSSLKSNIRKDFFNKKEELENVIIKLRIEMISNLQKKINKSLRVKNEGNNS